MAISWTVLEVFKTGISHSSYGDGDTNCVLISSTETNRKGYTGASICVLLQHPRPLEQEGLYEIIRNTFVILHFRPDRGGAGVSLGRTRLNLLTLGCKGQF